MTIGWHFDNSYSRLPKTFKEDINPVAVNSPEILILNKDLANKLNLDFSNINDDDLSKIFSGNMLPEGSNSIAQAYAGHQFGHFTMLGDGRAVLFGEHLPKIMSDLIYNLKVQVEPHSHEVVMVGLF